MAAVSKTHVKFCGEEPDSPGEESEVESDSGGGSNDEGSSVGAGDGEGDGEEEEDEDEEGGDGNLNAGWAEAMAKILGKKTDGKSSILVKNKELDKMKKKEKHEVLEKKKQDDKRRAWEMLCRDKPDVVKDRETEKSLQRIATRGVVQLFNAMKKHQKTIDDKVKEAGGSERKKAKILSSVSKKDFIDVLRRTEEGGGGSGKTSATPADDEPAWSVLRDDFMMGAAMRDWDKGSDGEGED